METVGSIQVVASINTKDYDAGKKHIESGNSELENSAKKTSSGFSAAWAGAIGGLVATVAQKGFAMISASIDGAVKRVDTLNNSTRTFENMGIATTDSKKAMDALQKSIKGLPTPLDGAVRGMTALTATYGNIEKGQKVFSALNNAILGFGGSSAEVENAITQLSQLPMDGPLDAETWNSLRDSGLTPVLVAMAKDSGMSVSQMKEAFGSGELTVQDFTDRLIKLNQEGGGGLKSLETIAKDSTSGIGTGFANMQTSVVRGMGEVIKAVGPANISGALSGIGEVFETSLSGVASIVEKQTPNIVKSIQSIADDIKSGDFDSIGEKIGKGIGKFGSYVVIKTNDIIKWFSGLDWGAIGLAVGGGAFAFTLGLITGIFSTDFLSVAFNFIKDNWGKVLLAVLTVAFAPAKLIGPVGKIFSSIFSKIPFGSLITNALKGIVNVIRAIFEPIRAAMRSVVDIILVAPFRDAVSRIGGILSTIWQIITTPFKLAIDYVALLIRSLPMTVTSVIEGVKGIFSSGIGFIQSIFSGLLSAIRTLFSPLVAFFQGVWSGITSSLAPLGAFFYNVFSSAWNGILSIWSGAGGFFSGIWGTIRSIFSGVAGYFGNVFSGAVNAVRGVFSGVIGFFSGIWSQIVSMFGSVGTSVGNAIGNTFKSTLNGVIRGAVGLVNGFIDSINGALGAINKIPGVHIGKVQKLGVPQFYSGGFTGRGGKYEAAGIVHKGEYVVPKQYVNQSTGLPEIGGNKEYNITNNYVVNNQADAEIISRKQAYAMGAV